MTLLSVEDRASGSLVTVLNGSSRTCVLVGRYALKFPSLRYGYRAFLRGLLDNCIEREWWRSDLNDGLCPILLAVPGGFLNVMPRCDPVVDVADVYDEFVNRGHCCEHPVDHHDAVGGWCASCSIDDYQHDYGPLWIVPCENKDDSFGWLGGDAGRLVVVDYATSAPAYMPRQQAY